MNAPGSRQVAIVGMAAIMPDAPDAEAFWGNITGGRYSISDVPPERWDPELYYDPDHHAPDKTYSKIGGWVREFPWDPIAWKLPVPPMVAKQMDEGQRWTISAARAALVDAGWPAWDIDSDKVAVVLGNAIGGEKHYRSSMRIEMPEFLRALTNSPAFAALDGATRERVLAEASTSYLANFTEITEDTMPGELSNVLAGRVANLFNFRGPNFTTDAACASGLAATWAAVDGLIEGHYDAVITGGVDRNMSVSAFVKFCKIGALSADGTRPFDAGANGFVMGEGAALFVLQRLEDAEKAGRRIYAVLTGLAGSSDGKGKGITAPNPVGQKLALQRAWAMAGADPASAGAIEAHGTSTSVGDAAELSSLTAIFGAAGVAPGSIALGSVKSNIGHLKAAAGTAGLFKMVRSLHEKVLAPSLNFNVPNPNVDWAATPFRVNTELRDWPAPANGDVRRGGVSAFGFGGTNFHAVVEEYSPGRYSHEPRVFAAAAVPAAPATAVVTAAAKPARPPLRGALVIGGADDASIVAQVREHLAQAKAGTGVAAAPPVAPDPTLASAAVRVAIDYADAKDLAGKLAKTLTAFETAASKGAAAATALWRMLRSQGVFVGRGPAPKVAFLYTGQGSQYANMLSELRAAEPVVAQTFDRADAVMTPLLGRPLSSYIFIDGADPAAVKQLENQLRQTEITQPAVLATDLSLQALLAEYGIVPDMVMGHSLGEYGALVAAGSLTFEAALEAVSARGREMASLEVPDKGAMAAVFGPLTEIQRIVDETSATGGYVVVANINSTSQAVVGGSTAGVEQAVEKFAAAGINAIRIPVSHAFHTSIVAPASEPLVGQLRRLNVQPPSMPLVANVTGDFYPANATVDDMLDMLGKQVASPVQFVKGLDTLYRAGARVFVEVGPKKALHGFAEDVLSSTYDDVLALFTNHPKLGDAASVNQALCGLWANGLGLAAPAPAPSSGHAASPSSVPAASGTLVPAERNVTLHSPDERDVTSRPGAGDPVAITGAALGLPGVPRVFDDENVARILAGQQFIEAVPHRVRQRMVDMRITRLVKSEIGGPSFETITDEAEVIKLAGQYAPVDVVAEFGVDAARDEALDDATRLAIGAGLDALRDAGIPLVMRYKQTTLGTKLPEKWALPDSMRDDTGVIFASAFPGYNNFAKDLEEYFTSRGHREQLLALEAVRARMTGTEAAAVEVDRRIGELRHELETHPYSFDRRFIFRALAMGHSQFAELIGARGPNTQINAACASTTQAVSLAEDWIRTGRARRVIIVSADVATAEHLMPWITSGFLASGAAATDDIVADAATPFDRRRHGMIVGMGAASLVIESADAAAERGIAPICEVLAAITANSAFHGTRLDVEHIGGIMESLVRQAEARGIARAEIASSTMFVSHETYTPARGGSAAAEINALRRVFGPQADQIVITNTKGFTGHAMGAGIEDVVAVKALETGVVPPVPNFREVDPGLGSLNLSVGGSYDVRYALRLAAGFGSQIAMTLSRWIAPPTGRRPLPNDLGYQHRIVDTAAFHRWLDGAAGHSGAELEVNLRRLRVVDAGVPTAAPAAVAAMPAATVTPVPVPAAAAAPVTAAAAAPVTAAAAAPAAPAPVEDPVTTTVVGIVAELTGYPAELLDLDLDLEADLGVDTVKQAEVFAAVREHFDVERDPNLRLRDFPTLTHVIGWVRDKTGIQPAAAPAMAPAVAAPAAVAAPVVATPAAEPAQDPVLVTVTAIVAELTGYPPELLDPDLDLEADLGVDTVKQAEVFAAVREHFDVERDPNLQLRDFPTLAAVVGWVRSKKPELAAAVAVPVAAAPVVAPVTVAAAAAPAPAPAPDSVLVAVTAIVAELTGYPPELLDPDLDLEADLGVDTVKQAEVFAAVREHYDVERDPNLQLRDFPTLAAVVGWVRSKKPDLAVVPAAVPVVASAPVATTPDPVAPVVQTGQDPVLAAVTAIVAELTGYPPELLDPDLDLEADLGVDTVKQAEVFAAVREHYDVERDPNLQLRDFPTLASVVGWVHSKKPELAAQAAAVVAAVPVPAAPVQPAASAEPAADGGDEVASVVVGIVAELTGYPPELLDLDLDLEADLGVDTVKQAEVFAAVREHYGVERDPNLQLRDFPTLNLVIGWVREKTGIQPNVAASVAAPAVAEAVPAVDASSPGSSGDEVESVVVGIVAELTGYPPELLDLDLDLEADLGVDTVKQAEVFAAVREHYGVERDPNLQLRDFPTLNLVIGWVREKTGIQPASATQSVPEVAESSIPDGRDVTSHSSGERDVTSRSVGSGLVRGDLGAIDGLPRRVPVAVLRPALSLCAPTGIALGEGSRVVVMLDEGGVGDSLAKRLRKLGVEVLTLEAGTATDDLLTRLGEWTTDASINGVFWLAGLDDEGALDGLDFGTWREALRRRVKALYATIRALYDSTPFLITATRLGGFHGYEPGGATSPLGGAVNGFAKAYQRECPAAVVKAVDLPASRKTAAIADVLIDEALRDGGCVEIGRPDVEHRGPARIGIALETVPFTPLGADGSPLGEGGTPLTGDSVVVVTGAAGSIVSAITADLAAASGATFHLLDLTPTPDAADPDLQTFATDKDALKPVIAARLKEAGERPTPVAIEKELARIERRAAALAAVQAVEAAGGRVRYHSVNLTDADAVVSVMRAVQAESGRVDLLLHAAGLEISRTMPDKQPAEFDLVFDVKADGWYSLVHAVPDLPIGASVVFSSVAGRFGNSGQPDYAAANNLLCAISSSLRRTRPGMRAIALDWTAWGGIGMATRGSIPKIMEMAGVQMLPPEAGVAWIRRELASSGFAGEVVVAGRLGQMAAAPDRGGNTTGLDADAVVGQGISGIAPVTGEVSVDVNDGVVVTTMLDPAVQPFLYDHRIEGIPVLPGVMGMESFAEAALAGARLAGLEVGGDSGYRVAEITDVRFLAPCKFYRDEPRAIRVSVVLDPVSAPDAGDGQDLVARCVLTAERTLAGSSTPRVDVHFTGTVRLTRAPWREEYEEVPASMHAEQNGVAAGQAIGRDLVYRLYFHGPAYQVVDVAARAGDGTAARMANPLPDNHVPDSQQTVTGPRLTELCFQTAGLFQAAGTGELALPNAVGAMHLVRDPNHVDATGLHAVLRAREGDGPPVFDGHVADGQGRVVLRLSGYRTIALPAPMPHEVRDPLRAVLIG
ncbi:MAG: SDR family NAD(P)-dependent oxidoreductase [Kineosporiaceae bacterium]|nr:SDR family NAD(P)-dependent oxidoreductase [Kineosporiaceae bacterium]